MCISLSYRSGMIAVYTLSGAGRTFLLYTIAFLASLTSCTVQMRDQYRWPCIASFAFSFALPRMRHSVRAA
ncbi:hypothetical protein QBC47DRAFT_378321 [Echria macrotheca]|uniref:Uncharacterized protein n=1 Tax=Echria macrotheca TaxID=438768 RepID=A0AAJ0BF17_9PEZI|nr:hypothetical protein QBC47DRAFT_378321 [Echria macrotheca]